MSADEVTITARNNIINVKVGEKLYQKTWTLEICLHTLAKKRKLSRLPISFRELDEDMNV